MDDWLIALHISCHRRSIESAASIVAPRNDHQFSPVIEESVWKRRRIDDWAEL